MDLGITRLSTNDTMCKVVTIRHQHGEKLISRWLVFQATEEETREIYILLKHGNLNI